jgi:hypothetical protein
MIGVKISSQEKAAPPAFDNRSALGIFSTRGLAVRLFITCWLVFCLHFATNIVREIYPAMSLGDHLSFDVSEYAGLHPDIFEMKDRGAFINNNPGASILGAIPYTLARPAIDRIVDRVQRSRAASRDSTSGEYKTIYPMAQEFHRQARERGLDVKFALAAWVVQAFCMAPISALGVVVMFYILHGLTSSTRKSLILALLYAFATPVFYRTAQLNQNLLVCHFALFAFAALWRPWDDALAPRRPRYLLAGLLAGWTVVLDYSGVVALLFISIYCLIRRRSLPESAKSRFDLLHFALGVLVCAAVLMSYQWSSFGHPIYPAQRYMPDTEFSGAGYRGMGLPQLGLLWDTSFGMRFGLFTSAPLLLLSLYIPGWFRNRGGLLEKREAVCLIVFSLAFFLFCAANQYGHLQFNSGVRYIVPVVPYLFLLASGVLLRMPRLLAVIAGIISVYWSWCLAMYRDVEQGLGIFESIIHVTFEGFRLPWLVTLDRMGYLPGGASALPLLILSSVLIWALWSIRNRSEARSYSLPEHPAS